MQNTFPIWVNEQEKTSISVNDRAVAYGDGLFETIRVSPKPVLDSYHFERLESGAEALGIPVRLDRVRESFERYADAYDPGIIKILVSRGVGGRGYLPPDSPDPVVVIQGFELPDYPQENYSPGIRLYRCETPITVNPRLQGIKHLNRLEQVLARQEFAQGNYQEGIMSLLDGALLECTMSNLLWIKQQTLFTTPLDKQAVNGTMQRYLIEHCVGSTGYVETKSDLTIKDLLAADDVFVCNSVFGVWPVRSVMDQELSQSKSDLMLQIQQQVHSLLS